MVLVHVASMKLKIRFRTSEQKWESDSFFYVYVYVVWKLKEAYINVIPNWFIYYLQQQQQHRQIISSQMNKLTEKKKRKKIWKPISLNYIIIKIIETIKNNMYNIHIVLLEIKKL